MTSQPMMENTMSEEEDRPRGSSLTSSSIRDANDVIRSRTTDAGPNPKRSLDPVAGPIARRSKRKTSTGDQTQHPRPRARKSHDGRPAKRGRPRLISPTPETLRQIEALAHLHCSEEDAATVLSISQSTFSAFLNEFPEARQAWDRGLAGGRISLRRAQFKEAERGNARMLIFLGQNYLGQVDKVEPDFVQTIVNYWTEAEGKV
jgi:hypothetical protein